MDAATPVDQVTSGTSTSTTDRISGLNELGKDDFLKLFVTRLANQDPLEPIKDEQFIAQLAQFTTLEQMYNMNDNLKNSLNWSLLLSQTINNTMATSLLGREVEVNASQVSLNDSGSTAINYDLEKGADHVLIKITDDSGTLIRSLSGDGLAAGPHEIDWDGIDAQGNRAPAGIYNIEVTAEDGDGNEVNASSFFKGEVKGVRYVDGNAMLMIGNALVSLGDVIQVSPVNNEG